MAKKGTTRFTSLTEWMDHLKKAAAKGGRNRAAKLTPKERSEIARAAAVARWKKTKRKKGK